MKVPKSNTFFELASMLSKIYRDEADNQAAAQTIKNLKPDQQQAFFDYCKKWKVAPMLYIQLKKEDLLHLFETSVATQFEAIYSKVQQENERRNTEAVKFLAEFNKQGIEVAILKGNLFIHTIHQDSGYKKMNDFDILIHAKDWPKVQAIYDTLGYIPLGFGWSGEKQKPAKFSHVGTSFISANHHCIIGTQWGLKSPSSRYTLNIEEAWTDSLPFDFLGVPVKQLSPEYNLLHLIMHMGIYKCGIRDCMDVYNLLLAEKNWDEDKLVAIFEKTNALEKAYFTLILSNICSDAVDQSLLKRLIPKKNNYLIKRLKSRLRLYEKTGDFQDAYHDYFQKIEINLFYFNIFPEFHKKAFFYGKILRLIFWPKKDIVLRLSDLTPQHSRWEKLLALKRAPRLVFSLIAEEIGWTFTLLLFFKLFFDLLLSLKNYIFKQESYFDYLKGRGISPQEIESAVRNIE
ncbi:MAG: nucleotidyltransferase family protein [Saprospiraceae bacterium]|nr:nucleotidyltransferase family protein [Saprospiraceae bacterium]